MSSLEIGQTVTCAGCGVHLGTLHEDGFVLGDDDDDGPAFTLQSGEVVITCGEQHQTHLILPARP